MRKLFNLFDPHHDNNITENLLLMAVLIAGGISAAMATAGVLFLLGVL